MTLLHVHRVLFSALKNAVMADIVGRNAAEAVEPQRPVRHEVETMGWAEVHRFLEEVTDPVYRTLVLLDIQTDLRRSEMLGLQWRDVDLAGGSLSVQRALIKYSSGNMGLTVSKTGQGRVVALSEESVDALMEHKDLYREVAGQDGFVFCDSDGSPLEPDKVTKDFKKMTKRAGIPGLRLHDLRHTRASLMLAEGVHLKIVSERLGHSNMGITGDLYSHVRPSLQREAVARFGAAWRKRNGNGTANAAR